MSKLNTYYVRKGFSVELPGAEEGETRTVTGIAKEFVKLTSKDANAINKATVPAQLNAELMKAAGVTANGGDQGPTLITQAKRMKELEGTAGKPIVKKPSEQIAALSKIKLDGGRENLPDPGVEVPTTKDGDAITVPDSEVDEDADEDDLDTIDGDDKTGNGDEDKDGGDGFER